MSRRSSRRRCVFWTLINFEIHATDLLNGHSVFVGTDRRRRSRIVHDAISVLERHELSVIAAVVSKDRLRKKLEVPGYKGPSIPPEACGLETFVQGFESFLRAEKSLGILISDVVSNPNDHRRLLAQSQDDGSTLFGVAHVIDTIHFVESHASPMVQLVDVVTYLLAQEHLNSHRFSREVARVTARVISTRRYP